MWSRCRVHQYYLLNFFTFYIEHIINLVNYLCLCNIYKFFLTLELLHPVLGINEYIFLRGGINVYCGLRAG